MMSERLPSWRPGPTRDSIEAFLDAARDLPVESRLACIDNDGTLWCEKPQYLQFYFFVDALQRAVAADPQLAEVAEFKALIEHDAEAMGEIGVVKIVLALAGLFAGETPDEFDRQAREFAATFRHPDSGRSLAGLRYQPMLELLDELRSLDFTICISTGGGTEFVRAISRELYRVPPSLVIGTGITYDYSDDELVRTGDLDGPPNEGAPKVIAIQRHFGQRPIFTAGNTNGDQHMMEWATAGDGPSLGLLVDHDDAEREYAYEGGAATFEAERTMKEIAADRGWVVASMKNDLDVVFANG